MSRKILRALVNLVAIGLVALTFSPLILRPGRIEPSLFSLPYTLWSSMLISLVLVLLTFVASKLKDED